MFTEETFAERTWYKSYGYYPLVYEEVNTNYSKEDCGFRCR